MQNGDTVQVGDDVLLLVEVDGTPRHVRITREAIEDKLKLPPDHAATFSPDERREFVARHLPEVIAAVHRKFQGVKPPADDVIVIGTGEL
jgi:hypothetical protein